MDFGCRFAPESNPCAVYKLARLAVTSPPWDWFQCRRGLDQENEPAIADAQDLTGAYPDMGETFIKAAAFSRRFTELTSGPIGPQVGADRRILRWRTIADMYRCRRSSTACSMSKRAECASAGRIIGIITSRRS